MSKLQLHKSESFQFGNLCPESKCNSVNAADGTSTAGVVEPVLPVEEKGPESGKQEENVPVVEVRQAEGQMAGVRVVEPVPPVHKTGPESGKQDETVPGVEVVHPGDQMAGVHVVKPVPHVHETGPESGKQEETVPGLEVINPEDQNATNPVSNNR